jgi:hypothetical protein
MEYTSEDLCGDEEVVMEAVAQDWRAMGFAMHMWSVKRVVLALQFANRDLQADKEVVMAAVGNNGLALQFSPALQADRDVVMAAVHQNVNAIKFAFLLLRDTNFMRAFGDESFTQAQLDYLTERARDAVYGSERQTVRRPRKRPRP